MLPDYRRSSGLGGVWSRVAAGYSPAGTALQTNWGQGSGTLLGSRLPRHEEIYSGERRMCWRRIVSSLMVGPFHFLAFLPPPPALALTFWAGTATPWRWCSASAG